MTFKPFFTQELLCFKPYYEVDADAGIVIENGEAAQTEGFKNAWDSYRIDYGGSLLTPVAVTGFCGETQPLYVVPPVNEAFLAALSDPGAGLRFEGWQAEVPAEPDARDQIAVTLRFTLRGRQTVSLAKRYPASEILVADSMPYISMWPFVKAAAAPGMPALDWREYFVSVHTRDFNESQFDLFEFPNVEARLNADDENPMRRVDRAERIRIDIFGGRAKAYQVHTNPFGVCSDDDGSFIMLKTEAFPRFLTLSVDLPETAEAVSVGCWAINDALAVPLPDLGLEGVLGFDFGGGSTVMALSVGGSHRPQFVPGPGRYLYDVFNPNWECAGKIDEDSGRRETWEKLQTYYLFGCKSSACDRIYNYPQLNHAADACGRVADTVSYVTGRAALVGPDYFKRFIDSSAGAASDICPHIRPGAGARADRCYEPARVFILTCLTWGVLAARAAGCRTVEIHPASYFAKNKDVYKDLLGQILTQLQDISGMGNRLTQQFFPAAAANARFLLDGESFCWHAIPIPNPDCGLMIADIGGRTTDISVLQFDGANAEAALADKIKSEIAFRYAGREIVDISLLRIRDFDRLWRARQVEGGECADAEKLKEVLYSFRYNGPFDPEYVEQQDFKRATAFVDWLLDHATLKEAYQGIQIGSRMDIMKCKYLALCWVLGRYAARLGEAGVIETDKLDGNHTFKIYLTGGAAGGVESFILSTVPDFLRKCSMSATLGYYSNQVMNPDRTYKEIVIDVGVLTRNNDKKHAMAFGLTELREAVWPGPDGRYEEPLLGGILPDDFVGFDLDDEGTFPAKQEEKPTLPPVDLDPALIRKYYKMIVQAIHFLLREPSVLPDYDEMMEKHGDHITQFIESRLHHIKVFNAAAIEGLPIVNELYALYTLEKYLDVWFQDECLKETRP